ncbi:MAG: hypothetical protein V8R10_00410 [Christensenellales bacterium]
MNTLPCGIDRADTFSREQSIIFRENRVKLVGAVHDFTDPKDAAGVSVLSDSGIMTA